MNHYLQTPTNELMCSGRIVIVSGVDLMKEVFALKTTANRPNTFTGTVRNRIITDGRSSKVGE